MSAIIAGPMMHYVSLYENSLTHTATVETSIANTTIALQSRCLPDC